MTSLPDYEPALRQALSGISPLERTEPVTLEHAGGRVLAKPVVADRDLPPFNRAQMDGYALRAAELVAGRAFRVTGSVPAGSPSQRRVPPGECVAIATGAALPDDVDTVIQHELSDRGDRSEHGDGTVRFKIDSIQPGHAVHPRGADARAGQTLVPPGTLLQAQHLGIAAAVGAIELSVRARPRAVVLTSGDEIVTSASPSHEMLPHQIRNSNGPLVCELLRRMGAHVVAQCHLPDAPTVTIEAVREAIQACDLVITVGGVSAGERDFFPNAFETAGVQPLLRGASIQPGRPIYVGRAPRGTVIVGLPGNPVSVLACACLFTWPIVRTMLGLEPMLPWREVQLAESVKPNPHRRAFRPAVLQSDGRAIVPAWAGSGDLAHTAPTHGLIELPVQAEAVIPGSRLRFLAWP